MGRKNATTEQLRDDIDRGHTGDKVNVPDPAAAPLGTDEEAAGTPLDGAVVAEVRDLELAKAPRRLGDEAHPWDDRRSRGRRVGPALVIVISALGLLAAVVWGLLS